MSEAASVRVVAAILRHDDRVLLCHRHPDRERYPDVWDLPGGHIEPSEEPVDALVRELGEELAIELLPPLGPPFQQLTDAAASVELTVWLIDCDGVVVNHAPEEHDELRWVTAGEISDLALAHAAYVDLLSDAMNA